MLAMNTAGAKLVDSGLECFSLGSTYWGVSIILTCHLTCVIPK